MLRVVNGKLVYVTQGAEIMFNNPTLNDSVADPSTLAADISGNSEAIAALSETAGTLTNDVNGIEEVVFNQKKEFVGKLTQVGTDAPTALISKDTITNIVFERSAVGIYTIPKVGAFPAGKTFPEKKELVYDIDGNLITIERTSDDVLTINTFAAADTSVLADGILSNQTIIIEIYA